MKNIKKYLLFILILCVFCSVALIGYITTLWGGRIVNTLEDELIPTADYLLKTVVKTPKFVYNISPPPGSTIKSLQRICVVLAPGALTETNSPKGAYEAIGQIMMNTTRIILNNYRVARDDVSIPSPGDYLVILGDGRPTGLVNACFTPTLRAGLHIVEIQTSSSWWGLLGIGKMHSYQWAYKVN